MEGYKDQFKQVCTCCVMTMVEDNRVKHEVFIRNTRSLQMLYDRFCSKINEESHAPGKLLTVYTGFVSSLYSNTIKYS